MPNLQLLGSIGADEKNDPDDIASAGAALSGLGLASAKAAAETGTWDQSFDETIRTFQENSGLEVDGTMVPGGPTETTINKFLDAPRRAGAIPRFRNPRTSSDRSGAPSRLPTGGASARSKSPVPRGAADPTFDRAHLQQFWPTAAPQGADALPTLSEQERILAGRGYRYRPDPMGRVGWGDWFDKDWKPLDPRAKQAAIDDTMAAGRKQSAHVTGVVQPLPYGVSPQRSSTEDTELGAFFYRKGRLTGAQAKTLALSPIGTQLRESLDRFATAANDDGTIPLAVWRQEVRRLGIEPGQIGPHRSELTLVTDDDPSAAKNRTSRSLLGQAWSWLTDDIPGLAEEKARAIEGIDAEIRKIQAEPRWRSNFLNLIAMQSLLEARTGLVGGFPTTRLDFALAGIDIIGIGMVGSRPILVLRQGNKIITSADLASGGFRSRQALDLGKDVPYDSHLARLWLERRFGPKAVESTTIPSLDHRRIQLAGKRHPVTGIVFDTRGYAIFDDIALFDTRLPPEIFWKSSVDTHKRTATLQLRQAIERAQVDPRRFNQKQLEAIYRGERDIPDLRWHHHQDTGRMQLVPEGPHVKTLHVGGRALRKGL